jgi:hypothetical protein
MTELASTTIARLYHSEAALMLDGSVVVSGSDPQDWSFPQEYRIERFSPPYLLNGQIRPGFTLPEKDWAYKLGYRIVLKGTASTNMKIVLVGGEPVSLPFLSRERCKISSDIIHSQLPRARTTIPWVHGPSCLR